MKVSPPNSREIPSTCLLAYALFQTFLIWYILCALDNYKAAKNTFKRFPNFTRANRAGCFTSAYIRI